MVCDLKDSQPVSEAGLGEKKIKNNIICGM